TSAKNQEVTRTTVHRLAEGLLDHIVPQGPTYALRSSSNIKGEWRLSDAESFRTVVPAMKAADPSEGSGSKHRLDLRDETIAPSDTEISHFSHSHMMASLVQAKGNPEVSIVHGTLNVGGAATKSSGVETLFEGLFFHKYGHMSAVVGASGDELKVVWTPPPASSIAAASPGVAVGEAVPPSAAAAAAPSPSKVEPLEDNSVGSGGGGDRLTSGINEADKGGESSNSTATAAVVSAASSSGSSSSSGDADGGSTNPVVVQTATGPPPAEEETGTEDGGEGGAVKEEEEEEERGGGDTRGRRALGDGGRVSGEGGGARVDGGWENGRSLERRGGGLGSTEQAATVAKSMGGWLWREKEGGGEERGVVEDGAGVGEGRRRALDGSGRSGDLVRHQVTPQRQEGDEEEAPRHQKQTVAGSRPSLLPRHLDDGAGAAGAAAEAAELDAPVTEEEAREGADEEEAGEAAAAWTR
ncbi:unnamed protein product, partial [Ectocarpus sp. 8 AP-2014]